MVFWAHQAELSVYLGENVDTCVQKKDYTTDIASSCLTGRPRSRPKKKKHSIVGKQEYSVGNFTPSWAGAHGRYLLAPQISHHPMLTPSYLSQYAKLHCRRTLWLKKSAWCFKCWGKSYKWKGKTFRILLGALGTGEGTCERSGFSASCGKCHG